MCRVTKLRPTTVLRRRSLTAGRSRALPSPLYRGPDSLGRQRHVNVADPEVRQSIDHRVLHSGRRPDRARLTNAFGAQGIVRAGRLGGLGDYVRDLTD